MASILGILSFDSGESVSAKIPERLRAFYSSMGAMVTGTEATFVGNGLNARLAIPKSNVKDGQHVCTLVMQEIAAWSHRPDVLIADLANPPRNDFPNFNLFQGLIAALSAKWWATSSTALAVVLLPRSLSPDDVTIAVLKPHLDAGRLALVDPSGRVNGILPNKIFRPEDYIRNLRLAQEDLSTLIEQKMIRRIGYFKRPPGRNNVSTKYFYDGSHCANEIATLLEAELNFAAAEQVFVHSPVSRWLRHISAPLSLKHGLETLDLEAVLQAVETAAAVPLELSPGAVVLLPLVDSGDTLKRISIALKQLAPDVVPTFVSVLATRRAGRLAKAPSRDEGARLGRRTISTDAGEISFQFLLEVEQIYLAEGEMPSSLRDHAGSSFDIDAEPGRLTSFAFWDMVESIGWKGEEDVPRQRSSIGAVPNFPEILRRHGPFLAYKIDKLLRESPRGLPVDPVFVCPLEKGAIEVANSLSSMFGYSSIRIPRAVLQEDALFATGVVQIASLRDRFPDEEWLLQLASSGVTSARAILMDEFRFSGETVKRLTAICRAAGLPVETHVALADFGPDGHEAYESMSLYRIPLMEVV